jgi:ribonuclease Z
VSVRELVVLGTASQAPTRYRNHNGYFLRWDGEGILFDPGEGTQRQFTLAGVSPAEVTRICITHFHGDHCLGLPGMILRLALDQGRLPVPVHYPAGGEPYFRRLRAASAGQEHIPVEGHPAAGRQIVHSDDRFALRCVPLEHRIDTLGWRLEEPDGRRMLPDRLAALGIVGPDVGRLQRAGSLDVAGHVVRIDEVSELRPGQIVAVVMDTAWCDGALELAERADLLICEATFLSKDENLAREHLHFTARQAGRLAATAGARRLVLTHFSRRYNDLEPFAAEARESFDDVVLAHDLQRIPIPPRRDP